MTAIGRRSDYGTELLPYLQRLDDDMEDHLEDHPDTRRKPPITIKWKMKF